MTTLIHHIASKGLKATALWVGSLCSLIFSALFLTNFKRTISLLVLVLALFTVQAQINTKTISNTVFRVSSNQLDRVLDNDTAQAAFDLYNLPPVAQNDSATVDQCESVMVSLYDNDYDPEGRLDTNKIFILDSALYGSLVLDSLTGIVTYQANCNNSGLDSFTYVILDSLGQKDTATVYINIQGVPNLISGYVFVDQNNNGVFDAGDQGQGLVRVYLYKDVNNNDLLDGGDLKIDSILTNLTGYYEFLAQAGNYITVINTNDIPPGYVFTTTDVNEASFPYSNGSVDSVNNFGYFGPSVLCYAISDGIFNDEQTDSLIIWNKYSGASQTIGELGTIDVEAMAMYLGDTIYATEKDKLGIVNKTTGWFTEFTQSIGTASNGVNSYVVEDVDGLTFDPFTGTLYASVHLPGTAKDLLIKINRHTGQIIKNAFGAGIDFITLDSLTTIDDIAIDPTSGDMYAVNSQGTSELLIKINPLTGASTLVGAINVRDIEGLGFYSDGTLYGTTGYSGKSTDNQSYSINKSNGQATFIGNFTPNTDVEACDCMVEPANLIAGVVFNDANADTIQNVGEAGYANVTVNLYHDKNLNGVVDANDPLVKTAITNSNGEYSFTTTAVAGFIIKVDETTKPIGTGFTTDNLEIALFTSFSQTDLGNDFGLIFLHLVTAANDTVYIDEDNVVVIDVQANDFDENGDTLYTTIIQGTSNGSTQIFNNDSVQYIPDANFCGVDSFVYVVADKANIRDTATVYIHVNCINEPPVAVNDTVTTSMNSSKVIDVQNNDSDPDGDAFTTTSIITGANNGTAFILGGDSINYIPNLGYVGTDTFVYVICDTQYCDTATVYITITNPGNLNVISGIIYLDNDSNAVYNSTIDAPQPTTKSKLYVDVNGNGSLDAGDYYYGTASADITGKYSFLVGAGRFITVIDSSTISNGFNLTTVSEHSVYFASGANLTSTGNDFGYVGEGMICYAVSDGIGNDETQDILLIINRVTGASLTVGNIGTADIEAMAIQNGLTIYAVNGGQVGTINKFTGAFTLLGPVGIATSSSGGPVTITDVDGLSFDPFTNVLYATHHANSGKDLLLKLNTTTGRRIANAFGTGIDYIVLDSLNDIDDIAIDPIDGQMYAINSQGTSETLIKLDKNTGKRTLIGVLNIPDLEGLGFYNDGTMFASTGYKSSTSATRNQLYSVNKSTAQATYVGTFAENDIEACDCMIKPPSVFSGLVYNDKNINTTHDSGEPGINNVTVNLYQDVDGNGEVGASDLKVQSTVTNSTGTFSFKAQGLGKYVVNITTSTLPSGFNLTTDNKEAFEVTTTGVLVSNLHFGASDSVPANQAPVAVNDTDTVSEDNSKMIAVQANDYDPEGAMMTTSIVSLPDSGDLSISGVQILYTPRLNFFGFDTFYYSITDTGGLKDTARVIIEVFPVNDPPIVTESLSQGNGVSGNRAPRVDTIYSSYTEDTPRDICLNYTDPEGDSIYLESVTSPHATNSIYSGLTCFLYSPKANYAGMDTITVIAADDGTPVAKSRLIIIMSGIKVNDNPIAVNDVVSTPINIAVDFNPVLNDIEVDKDLLRVSSYLNGPTNGQLLALDSVNFRYTPNNEFIGEDSFQYSVCDTTNLCDTAWVVIRVGLDPVAPVAVRDTLVIDRNSIGIVHVLGNDYDVNLDPLTASAIVSNPVTGAAILKTDSSIEYSAGLNYVGLDSFTYSVCDTTGLCDTTWVLVEVTSIGNLAPVAMNDTLRTAEDQVVNIDVFVNDYDPENDAFTATLITSPTMGQSQLLTDGVFKYTPNRNFYGKDSFRYAICDIYGACDTAWVQLIVNNLSDNPEVVDSAGNKVDTIYITTMEDTPLETCLNVFDADGDAVKILKTTSPVNGAVTAILKDTCFVYSPSTNYSGQDTFTVTVSEKADTSNNSKVVVIVTILPVNDPPIANNDDVITVENVAVSFNVGQNDNLTDGVGANYTRITAPKYGVLSTDNAPNFTYLPDSGYTGLDTFLYQLCDNQGLCDTARVRIIMDENFINPAPVAVNDSDTTLEDEPVLIEVMKNDFDPGSDVIVLSSIAINPANGTASINGNDILYTPAVNFNGLDSFSYIICDDGTPSACDAAMVYVYVIPVNDAPIANNDFVITEVNTDVSINATANDNPIDNAIEDHEFTLLSLPMNGAVNLIAASNVIYMPDSGFIGVDSFKYSICDTGMLCDSATIYINVINSSLLPPVALNDVDTVEYNTGKNILVINNDYDTDGTLIPSSIVIEEQGYHGIATPNFDGTVLYVPQQDFIGMDTFLYSIRDNDGLISNFAVVKIYVREPTPDLALFIPNVYTPNNDGDNDVWKIRNINLYPENEVILFNRWGNEVRRYKNYDNLASVWDGEGLNDGTYYYILTIRYKGRAFVRDGYVEISR